MHCAVPLLSLLPWNVSPLTHSRLFTWYAEEEEEEEQKEEEEKEEEEEEDEGRASSEEGL